MSIRYKFDVLSALKKQGYSQTRIRNEQLIGQATLTQLRHGELTSWRTINMICKLLNIQPGDLLEYVPDEELPVVPVAKEESAFAKAMAQMDRVHAEDHERMLLASGNYKGVEVIEHPKRKHPLGTMLQNKRPTRIETLEDATAEATPVENAVPEISSDIPQKEPAVDVEAPLAVEAASVEPVANPLSKTKDSDSGT